MTNQDNLTNLDKILNLHILVLKDLLNSVTFQEIKRKYSSEIADTNYLTVAKKNNLLVIDENENLIAAFPVSPFKTNFAVNIENIGFGYAMCAIDALGIAYTFQEKTTITSITTDTKEEVSIEIDPNKDVIDSNNEFFVTYKDPDLVNNIAIDQCPVINFYSEEKSVIDSDLIIFSFKQALQHAKDMFSIEAFKKNIKGGFKAIEKKNLN